MWKQFDLRVEAEVGCICCMWGFRSPAVSTTSRDRLFSASLLKRVTIDINGGAFSKFLPDMRWFEHIGRVCLMRAHLIQKCECVEEITGWSWKAEVSFASSLKLYASGRLSPWVLERGFPITDPVMWRIFPSLPYKLKESNTSVVSFRLSLQIIPVLWYQQPKRRKKHLDKVQTSNSSSYIWV